MSKDLCLKAHSIGLAYFLLFCAEKLAIFSVSFCFLWMADILAFASSIFFLYSLNQV